MGGGEAPNLPPRIVLPNDGVDMEARLRAAEAEVQRLRQELAATSNAEEAVGGASNAHPHYARMCHAWQSGSPKASPPTREFFSRTRSAGSEKMGGMLPRPKAQQRQKALCQKRACRDGNANKSARKHKGKGGKRGGYVVGDVLGGKSGRVSSKKGPIHPSTIAAHQDKRNSEASAMIESYQKYTLIGEALEACEDIEWDEDAFMPLARRLMDVPIPRVTFDALTSTLNKPTAPPAAVYIERHGHEQDQEDVWRLPTLNDITFVWGNQQYLDWWGWEALEDRLHVEKHRTKGKGAKYVRDIHNVILESTFGDGDLQPKRTTYYRFNDPRQLGIEMEMKGVPVCQTTNGKLKAKPACAKGLECVEGLDVRDGEGWESEPKAGAVNVPPAAALEWSTWSDNALTDLKESWDGAAVSDDRRFRTALKSKQFASLHMVNTIPILIERNGKVHFGHVMNYDVGEKHPLETAGKFGSTSSIHPPKEGLSFLFLMAY